MPAFLLPILGKILEWGAPYFIKLGLSALERKYPGLTPILQSVMGFIDEAPSQSAATQAAKEQMDKLRFPTGNDVKS